MRKLLMIVIAAPLCFAQDQAKLQRPVADHTLTSPADPAVTLTFPPSFDYVGGQVIDIFHVAGAEQHFFVESAPDRSVRRFYWIQFEHYYPSNSHKYDYSGIKQQPVKLGQLPFMADVIIAPNYFAADRRPGSDSQAALNFLHDKGHKTDGTFARVRMFHLPDDTHRKELMIIYGELVPPGTSEAEAKTAAMQHLVHDLMAK